MKERRRKADGRVEIRNVDPLSSRPFRPFPIPSREKETEKEKDRRGDRRDHDIFTSALIITIGALYKLEFEFA